MKRVYVILLLLLLPGVTWADSSFVKKDAEGTEITMSATEALKIAAAMIDNKELDVAEQILTNIPSMGGGPLEIERWFLLGRLSAAHGDYQKAIQIYRTILDSQPSLARVRFELAICYMETDQWYRADYQLRLAMAGKDLPENVRQMMEYYRYVVRQNKNWNVWFNFGAAPDNNVNNASGGQECIITIFGPLCRNLIEPESAVGLNFQFGGDYEFKLSNQWRWKSEAGLYTNVYDLHDYDDLYLYASTGPRFIWNRGDVWLAGVASRRWYGWHEYNWSAGTRISTNYDFTNKLTGGLSLQFLNNRYDYYGRYLNGATYISKFHFAYSILPNLYTVFRGGVTREDAASPTYSYWMPDVSFGVGAELPYGFNIYFEPSIYWQFYDAPQWSVKYGTFMQITEHDFSQRYVLSVSNNNFEVMDFVPNILFSYTRRDSNIWQREYDRWAIEFTLSRRF